MSIRQSQHTQCERVNVKTKSTDDVEKKTIVHIVGMAAIFNC